MIIKFESAFEILKYFYGCYSFLNIPSQCVMVLFHSLVNTPTKLSRFEKREAQK